MELILFALIISVALLLIVAFKLSRDMSRLTNAVVQIQDSWIIKRLASEKIADSPNAEFGDSISSKSPLGQPSEKESINVSSRIIINHMEKMSDSISFMSNYQNRISEALSSMADSQCRIGHSSERLYDDFRLFAKEGHKTLHTLGRISDALSSSAESQHRVGRSSERLCDDFRFLLDKIKKTSDDFGRISSNSDKITHSIREVAYYAKFPRRRPLR